MIKCVEAWLIMLTSMSDLVFRFDIKLFVVVQWITTSLYGGVNIKVERELLRRGKGNDKGYCC